MRALETGRPLVRATNTGITSATGYDGREAARLPWFTRGILEVEVTGRAGVTPYVRFGDALAVGAALAVALAAIIGGAVRGSTAAGAHEKRAPHSEAPLHFIVGHDDDHHSSSSSKSSSSSS